jgi:hypothetical protein
MKKIVYILGLNWRDKTEKKWVVNGGGKEGGVDGIRCG